jgi:NAD(P)H-hydrate epimerase
VFGFQFRPPVDAPTAALFTWANTHPSIQLRAAVDLPSGLGERNGETVFRADFTYATGIVKSPVLKETNAKWVGRVRYLDLGFFDDSAPPSAEQVLTSPVLASLAKLRPSQSDKRKFGHVFVVGGSLSYPGAVMLAVRAALRSGAGLVTAFVPEKLVPYYAAEHPEAMWVGCPVGKSGGLNSKTLPLIRKRLKRANALLVGPGLGAAPETIAMVKKLAAECPVPLVLDADAQRAEVVAARKGKPFICTPHAGEYQRIEKALEKAPAAVVTLKGPITRVLSSAVSYFSLHGGPVLARGGSGDILAGLTGGLLAQTPDNLLLAACRAVTWHGLAADLLARTHGQVVVETSQLLEQLGPALVSTHVPTTTD